jgi:hypothetical protein
MENPYPLCVWCDGTGIVNTVATGDGLHCETCKGTGDAPGRQGRKAWSEGYAAARAELEALLRAQAEAVIASLRADGQIK